MLETVDDQIRKVVSEQIVQDAEVIENLRTEIAHLKARRWVCHGCKKEFGPKLATDLPCST